MGIRKSRQWILIVLSIAVLVLINKSSAFGYGSVQSNHQILKEDLAHSENKKVIVLIIDNAGLSDLNSERLPHFKKIVNSGGIGLFYTKRIFSQKQPHILDKVIESTMTYAQRKNIRLTHIPGLLTDNKMQLLTRSLSAASKSLITIIDLRPIREHYALERISGQSWSLYDADKLLGEFLQHLPVQRYTYFIISGSPAKTEEGNETLSPLIIYEDSGSPGILGSYSTRRKGLISAADIMPTIFGKLNKPIPDAAVYWIPDRQNYHTIITNLLQNISLRNLRYVFHGVYAVLLLTSLILLYLPTWRSPGSASYLARALAVTVFALPAFVFYMSPILPPGRYPISMLFFILMALVAAIFSARSQRTSWISMGLFSSLTSIYLIVVLIGKSNLLLWNPIGFADIFKGGRFYGINNDCMGILIGSSAFSLFYLYDNIKLPTWIRVLGSCFYYTLAIIALSPAFGANAGGTIVAIATGAFAIVASSGRWIGKKKIVLIIVLAVALEFIIAYIDYHFGIFQSHAGKAIGTLFHQGPHSSVIDIIKNKLSLFGLMLLVPPWNILLIVELIFMVKSKVISGNHRDFLENESFLLRLIPVLFYGGLVAIIFNDTGIIAASLMLIYLTIPVGVLLQRRTANESQGCSDSFSIGSF